MKLAMKLLFVVGAATALVGCSSVSLDEGAQGSMYGSQAGQGANANAKAGGTNAPATVVIGDKDDAVHGASLYFGFDQYDVSAQDTPLLMKQASYLRAHPTSRVKLEGHTDERGGREYNLALGQKRAEAVRQRLLFLGVPGEQMEAVSYGKEKPKALGHDEASWAENRRVDIVYRP